MVDWGDWSRKKVFEEANWVYYLVCGGCAVGGIQPLVLSDQKTLCQHGQAGTAECFGEQGWCHTVDTCLCCTEHFAYPPAKGFPCCYCFGKKLAGEVKRENGSLLKGDVFDNENVMNTEAAAGYWLIYCLCGGVKCHKIGVNGQAIARQFKMLCCAGSSLCEKPCEGGVWCSQFSKFLCIWNECSMPPAPGGPTCAICTWKLNKDHDKASSDPPLKPVQADPAEVVVMNK